MRLHECYTKLEDYAFVKNNKIFMENTCIANFNFPIYGFLANCSSKYYFTVPERSENFKLLYNLIIIHQCYVFAMKSLVAIFSCFLFIYMVCIKSRYVYIWITQMLNHLWIPHHSSNILEKWWFGSLSLYFISIIRL